MSHVLESNDYNVVKKFEAIAQDFPEYTAITDRNKKISYKSLNEKSNQIAEYLKTKNVKSGDFVAILLEPNIDFIVCMLAAIKIGAVYLPLDISAPKKRINEILSDAKPGIIITNEKFKSLIHESYSISNIKDIKIECINFSIINQSIKILPSSPVYMMYTSGSTGKPKGVIIPHQAVVNLCYSDNYAKIKQLETVSQFSNLAFDGATFEIWSALLNGATLSIIPLSTRINQNKLQVHFRNNMINCLFLPTGYFHQLIKSFPETFDTIKKIMFGGEQVNHILLKSFLKYRKSNNKPIILINAYGPTEATTCTYRHVITENDDLSDEDLKSIGKPFQNIKTYILDEQMQPSDVGELYISGINLALGYHNSDAQNKERFIKNPFSNEALYQKIYKTGDKVRLLPSGNVLCLGRLDDQVKIGGFRIHLNEIENKLMTYPNIALATVIVEIGGGDHKMLTAYLVLSDKSQAIHADEIRSFLAESLPAYMLPSKYVMVEELPLTLVGKVDKKKLDQIPHVDLSFHIDASNSHPVEQEVQSIWCHLLNRTSVDIHKNFFDLGANSLLITESCSLINQKLHAELKIADILAHPTINKLSRYIEGDIDIQSIKKHKNITSSDIAIIGMSCRFPKANALNEFWDNLRNQVDCLERFSLSEDDLEKKNYVPVRGVLSDIESFDANFFGFSPVDASITDPQHRIFLEVAWEALEHAGVAPHKSADKTISVFAGMTDSMYLQENLLKNNWFLKECDHFQQRIANSIGMLSTQLSYRLNLKGRSVNVNTACSTGLVAVDQACQDLMLGESDIALAGAVSIIVPQQKGYQYQEGSIVSLDGICAPFSDKANGTVFSNGIGVVILKRLDDAVKEGDTIYAVIKGRGVNNDGSDKLGYAAPSRSGQIACILSALEKSNLKGDDIRYIEAHGTATHLGDIVEFDALKDAFKTQTTRKQFCALGTVKSNIGHTDVAAGMAGLIKTALCLHNQYIPSMPHYENPNPELRIDKSPFFINKEPIVWDNKSSIHLAGVSAFGVGGTNIHMILSEYRAPKKTNNKKSNPTQQLIVLSAKSQAALEEMTENFISYLSKLEHNTPDFLQRAAFTLQTGREDFAYRRYAIGQNRDEIKESLSKYAIQYCEKNLNANIVFMFPGQGTQYPKMAQELMQVPYFEKIVNLGTKLASKYLNCDFLSLLQEENPKELNETQYAQPALFIIEYALAKLLMHYGMQPNALIGHSLGEYVAACLAGVFSFEDGIALVCQRGLLMASAPKGAMLAIECSIEDFEKLQKTVPGIELALYNSNQHCVASGTSKEIELLEEQLKINGMTYQKLNVSHAFHSRLMDAIKDNFIDMLSNINFNIPNIPIISNLTGDWLSAKDAVDLNYWYQHLRNTVKLKNGLDTLTKDKNSFFIEVGPKRSLSYFLKSVLGDTPKHTHTITHTLAIANDLQQIFAVVGLAWIKSININWPSLYGNANPCKTALPTYSFQKTRFWLDADNRLTFKNKPQIYIPSWSSQPIPLPSQPEEELNSILDNNLIIFSSSNKFSDYFLSSLKKIGINPIVIEATSSFHKKNSNHFLIDPANPEHYSLAFEEIKFNSNSIVVHLLSLNNCERENTIEDQLNLSFYSFLYGLQAYIKHNQAYSLLKYAVVTTGVYKILGNEIIHPANASLLGGMRVAQLENTNIKFKFFDIETTGVPEHNNNYILSIIDSCIYDLWENSLNSIAFRQYNRYELDYVPIKNPRSLNRFSDNGVYLITGGLGGISFHLCKAILSRVKNPTFILVSRGTVIEQSQWSSILSDSSHIYYSKIKNLNTLVALGATLYWESIDITDIESVTMLINRYTKICRKINGVIHAAGVAGDGLIQLKSKEKTEPVFKSKFFSAYILAGALKNLDLDFFVLMSSIAALTGEVGQVDYAAANACLDSFAVSNLFPSKFTVSINWNTWQNIGMASDSKLPVDINFDERNNFISPKQGERLFLETMESAYQNVVISNYSLNEYQCSLTQNHNHFSDSRTKALRNQLNLNTHYDAPKSNTEKKLIQLWQDNLGIDGIGVYDDFFMMGGHSLNALKLVDTTNKIFNNKISIQHIYKNPTIHALAKHLDSNNVDAGVNIVVEMKKSGKKSPIIFCCHPISGLIYCFESFLSNWQIPVNIYGLQDPSISYKEIMYNSIISMAESYLMAIKTIQPEGPYNLLGYSFGGTLLYEIGYMLQKNNEKVNFIALIDGWCVFSEQQKNEQYFKNVFKNNHQDLSDNLINLAWSRMELLFGHTPTKTKQDIILFKATELLHDYISIDNPSNGWSLYTKGKILNYGVKANHHTIINKENTLKITKILENFIS